MISPSPITFTKRMEENKMNYYLGFDAGTQSVKVAVYDEDMNCIVSSSAPTTLTYPEPGWVSMDVDEYLALTIKGMKECASQMKEKGLDVTKIKSIMGDGVICGICGVDKDGNAITPYINYLDSRTKEDVELVNSWELEIFGKETGNPEANCMFPAMFARWFLKNIGDIVSMLARRWWSIISRIEASPMPSTAWLFSLWSTSISCLPCISIK